MDSALIQDLFDYLDRSPTALHGAAEAVSRLEKKGFIRLDEQAEWNLKEQTGYYVLRNGSSLLAFHTGSLNPAEKGFRIVTAHTDSPTFRLKNGELKEKGGMLKAGVEVVGGPIFSTWLDRDLSLAGRVLVREKDGIRSILYKKDGASVLIPNPAIHLNRDVNQGFEYNPQKHLSVLIGRKGEGSPATVKELVAADLGLDAEAVLDADIYLYDTAKAAPAGWSGEFFASGRIDNLAMCHAALEAVTGVSGQDGVTLAALFDNEETGSLTPHGADSSFLESLMERIVLAAGGSREDYMRSLASSFIVSADAAHGIHPNFADYHDGSFAPVINGGPAVKMNAGWNYSSTGETAARFRLWCDQEGVPCQTYINRSDKRTGKTLGPLSASRLGIPAVDVGNPMWSMHSVRETAGVKDHEYMIRIFKRHYRETGR